MKNQLVALLLCALLSHESRCQQAFHHSLFISEIFADPSPAVALPPYEFVEWYNSGNDSIDLFKWKLTDGSTTGIISTHYKLGPKSYVILCSNSALGSYSALAPTVALSSFPSLNNEGDTLTILSPTNQTVFSVAYTDDWYLNDFKKAGGWSLELIDLLRPCSGSVNWKASTFAIGGTPGKPNSVKGQNETKTAIRINNARAINGRTVVVDFNQTIDSAAFLTIPITIQGYSGNILKRELVPPLFQQARLGINSDLDSVIVYNLTIEKISNCYGEVGTKQEAKCGMALAPKPGVVLINELLFDPPPEGADYIECYHAGTNAVNLKELVISQRSESGIFSNSYPLTERSFFLYPGERIVFSEKPEWVRSHYPMQDSLHLFKIAQLPSLPDDKGWVALRYQASILIDEFRYHKDMHYGLLNNPEGVALERISIKSPTDKAFNWTSAAASVGFGTPGLVNSASTTDSSRTESGMMKLSPEYISPNNDGRNDRLSIQFSLNRPNWQVTIKLYDITGRFIRKVVEQYTLGLESEIFYNGTDEHNIPLNSGHYVLLAELLNTDGETKRVKRMLTVVN